MLHWEQCGSWSAVHKVLFSRLVKLAQESVVRWTDRLNMTIAIDWDIKPQTKQIIK